MQFKVSTDCVACHADVHRGAMGKDCRACHKVTRLRISRDSGAGPVLAQLAAVHFGVER